jgi:two-component system cell cycle response regulator CpdR
MGHIRKARRVGSNPFGRRAWESWALLSQGVEFIPDLQSARYSEHPTPTISGKQTDMARILLAEDDDSLRGFLARALERAGFEVQACADGEEAVQHLDHPWDLLLTDIVMPGMDGIEVARQAAARDPALRIMFITGFAAVALSAQDRAPAGAKVLSKPVHLRDLVAEVEKMMAA